MSDPRSIVIIGAGECGVRAALTLRVEGYTGEIALIHGEAVEPYERPPLSKPGTEDIFPKQISGTDRLTHEAITVFHDQRATAIDRTTKTVRLSSGKMVPYDRLLLATGARPRPLMIEGREINDVRLFRTIVDAKAFFDILSSNLKILLLYVLILDLIKFIKSSGLLINSFESKFPKAQLKINGQIEEIARQKSALQIEEFYLEQLKQKLDAPVLVVEGEKTAEAAKSLLPEYFIDKNVLDVGAGDINGNNRILFQNCKYEGNDVTYAKNITIVSRTKDLPFISNTFDTIVSTECFEHDPEFKDSILKIYNLLKLYKEERRAGKKAALRMLFRGVSGSGKSMLSQAIAKEIKSPTKA